MKSRRRKKKQKEAKKTKEVAKYIFFCYSQEEQKYDTSLTSDLAPALSQTADMVGMATNKGPPFSRRAETHYHGDTHTSNSFSLTISFPFYFLFPVSKYFILMTSDVLLLTLITLLRLGDFLMSQRDFYLGGWGVGLHS